MYSMAGWGCKLAANLTEAVYTFHKKKLDSVSAKFCLVYCLNYFGAKFVFCI